MRSFAAFADHRLLARGALPDVLRATREALDLGETGTVLFFDEESGAQVDFDLRGTPDEVVAREAPPPSPPRPGRPKLGVVGREVSLLPAHWEWLEAQPAGASAALRRLVEHAIRTEPRAARAARRRQAAGRFMTVLAGHRAHFEEALRALYAVDDDRLAGLMAEWPADVQTQVKLMCAVDVDDDEAVGGLGRHGRHGRHGPHHGPHGLGPRRGGPMSL